MSYTVRNLLIALVLASIGVALLVSYVNSREQAITQGQEFVEVLVAQRTIPSGTPANRLEAEGYVSLQNVRRDDTVPQALSSLEKLEDQAVSTTILEGHQVSARSFDAKSGLSPAEQISGTQRVMAVPLSSQGGVAAQLEPGDRVDVVANVAYKLLVPQGGGFMKQDFEQTIMFQDLLVLQTPRALRSINAESPASYGYPGVRDDDQLYTLQVSDDQALKLAWAQARSTNIDFIALLRPANNAAETELQPIDQIPDGILATLPDEIVVGGTG